MQDSLLSVEFEAKANLTVIKIKLLICDLPDEIFIFRVQGTVFKYSSRNFRNVELIQQF